MKHENMKGGSYGKFFAMISASMMAMFFLMYLNSYKIIEHAWFSETRLFMAFIMGAAMTVVMLGFMWSMYRNRALNCGIAVGAVLVLCLSLWLVRSQKTVSDEDYMQAMIPHHSIAILTSERARIEDPRVRRLANEIISAQRREIKEMEWLIADIRKNGAAADSTAAAARPVPKFPASPE